MWQSPDSKTYNKNWIWLPFFQWKKEFWKISPIVEQYCSEPIRIAEKWDILLSVRAPVWPTNLADQRCCIGRWLWAIRSNKEYCITSYLLYYFKKFQVEIANLGKWSTFDAITKADLENIEIPLPPLPTQHAIVARLDEASTTIQAAKSAIQGQIDALDTLRQSSLGKVFDGSKWSYKRLDQVSEVIMGQSPKGEAYNSIWDGMPLINWPVEFWKLPFSETIKSKFTTEITKVCKKWDLLICVRGATTWRTNIAWFDACIGRGVAAVRAYENQFYINYFILYKQAAILAQGKWSTFPAITTPELKSFQIPLPPLLEQQQIVSDLDELSQTINNLKTVYTSQLTEYDALWASILDKAFRGELVS